MTRQLCLFLCACLLLACSPEAHHRTADPDLVEQLRHILGKRPETSALAPRIRHNEANRLALAGQHRLQTITAINTGKLEPEAARKISAIAIGRIRRQVHGANLPILLRELHDQPDQLNQDQAVLLICLTESALQEANITEPKP